jgi:dTDP-4-amino-4,6-dideoxygalactose transaminase
VIPFTIPEVEAAGLPRLLGALLRRGGTDVEALEAGFRGLVGTRHAIALASGRSALQLLYRFAGCSGGKVLASPYTCVPAIDAIRWAGARPVFADIDPRTYNLAFPEGLAARRDIRAVCLSYLYGLVDDPAPFLAWARERGALVVEDSAIALGATIHGRPAGSLADAGVFSLQSSKIISAWRGGVVTTDRDDVASFLRAHREGLPPPSSLRLLINAALLTLRRGLAHPILYRATFYPARQLLRRRFAARLFAPLFSQDPGEAESGASPLEPPSTEAVRFSAAQAALAAPSLARVPRILEKRRAIASRYREALSGEGRLMLAGEAPGLAHAFGRFPARIPGMAKQEVARALAGRGVEVGLYYPYTIPETAHFRGAGSFEVLGDIPNARAAARETFLLPMHTRLRPRDVDRVIDALRDFLAR